MMDPGVFDFPKRRTNGTTPLALVISSLLFLTPSARTPRASEPMKCRLWGKFSDRFPNVLVPFTFRSLIEFCLRHARYIPWSYKIVHIRSLKYGIEANTKRKELRLNENSKNKYQLKQAQSTVCSPLFPLFPSHSINNCTFSDISVVKMSKV